MIGNRLVALVAVLISIGAVMGQITGPGLNLTKTVEPDTTYSGENVTYTFFVNNTGEVDITAINVTDTVLGLVAGPFDLAPGKNYTISINHTVYDDTLNNATAEGFDDDGYLVNSTAWAFVDVIHPNLTLNKTANTTMTYSGDHVTYTLVVNNTGDVDLTQVNLTDDALGDLAGPFDLVAGEVVVFKVTTALVVDTLNNATVLGIDPLGGEVNATASAFVDVIHPELVLTKTVEPETVNGGENVTYTFFLDNTGDVNITAINITDNHLGHIAGPFDLAPGENHTARVNSTMYVATHNTATAIGFDPLGNEVYADDSTDVNVITTSDIRSIGYWKHQFSDKGHRHIGRETLETYLALIAGQSSIFEEVYPLSHENATDYFWMRHASMLNRSVQQCLACWLNWANGAVSLDEMVDTDWDGQPDMTFSDAIAIVEDLIANGETKKDYQQAKDICDSINNMGDQDEEDEKDEDEDDQEDEDEEDDEDGEDDDDDDGEGEPQGRGPPENKGEPQGRGPPEDKTPPVKRGPPENKGEPQGRGPPEDKNSPSKPKKPKK